MKDDLTGSKAYLKDHSDNTNMPYKIEASWEIERVVSGTKSY